MKFSDIVKIKNQCKEKCHDCPLNTELSWSNHTDDDVTWGFTKYLCDLYEDIVTQIKDIPC